MTTAKLVDEIDDLRLLISLLPKRISDSLFSRKSLNDINEIVLDLGYFPEIRIEDKYLKMEKLGEVLQEDIDHVVKKIGVFNSDNRAGIERTLHRISAIKNRMGKIIGLTCRVGRAIVGTIEIIRDIVESSKNILFLGAPGIGKTTKLRETARVLSQELSKRVIVVDTSNEIAGDGDIPHPGIGTARRMQVPSPDMQHRVMIEAVENHTPEVVIVDEIGTSEEAHAARTIAERGVQLIATAHGYTLENIIKNPVLSDLVGGVQSVILGDEEAKWRGTQKTVQERKSLPTFEVIVEINERDIFAIYNVVKQAVDLYLRGSKLNPEIRTRALKKTEETEKKNEKSNEVEEVVEPEIDISDRRESIFSFGINRIKIKDAICSLEVPAKVVNSINEADLVLTVKSKMGPKSKIAQLAQSRKLPVHVLKANSQANILRFFRSYFKLTSTDDDMEHEARLEAERACERVKSEKCVVDLVSRPGYLRKIQHEVAEKYGLTSLSTGEEENRRVRIYPTELE
ncbi:R3H domain-containing nucleic acid-binding protein [Candidatus Margulisiibacteriota bacterium]